jgi:HSP20 family protein
MNESVNKTTRVLTFLLAGLIALAGVQAYLLFDMHHRLESNVANAATTAASDEENGTDDNSIQTFKLAPSPKSGAQSDPFHMLVPSPLNSGTWDPYKEIQQMRKEMERLFGDSFGPLNKSAYPAPSNAGRGLSLDPEPNISDDHNQYVIRMDLPGLDKSKIDARVEGRTLTVSGVTESDVGQKLAGKEIAKGREVNRFERMMTLPGPVKSEGMKVNYDKGVLTITIPKAAASSSGGKFLIFR